MEDLQHSYHANESREGSEGLLMEQHLLGMTLTSHPSPTSGRSTFVDSAYGTQSRMSHHVGDDGSSICHQRSDLMEEWDGNTTTTPDSALKRWHVSPSSTTTPITFNQNSQPQVLGQSQSRRPQKKGIELTCFDCGYPAKSRSDLK